MRKKLAIVTLLVILLATCFPMTGCSGDYWEYEGKKYVPVTFNQDIFTCGFGMSGEFEVDETWPEYIYPMPDSFQDKIKMK